MALTRWCRCDGFAVAGCCERRSATTTAAGEHKASSIEQSTKSFVGSQSISLGIDALAAKTKSPISHKMYVARVKPFTSTPTTTEERLRSTQSSSTPQWYESQHGSMTLKVS